MKNTHLTGRNAKWIARNPIARALSMKTLRETAIETKARCLSIEAGEKDQRFIQNCARFFTVVLIACEYDKLAKREDYNFKELILLVDKALLHLVNMSNKGFLWEYSHALDITDAIDASTELTSKLSADAVNNAWHATE
jgi:hypothetical protein